MAKMPAKWTPQEDAMISERFHAGEIVANIAKQLPGRTQYAVQNRLKRLGLRLPPGEARRRLDEAYRKAHAERRIGRKKGSAGTPHSEATKAKKRQIMLARMADPVLRERHRQASIIGQRSRDMAAIGRKVSETKLRWCPVHLRPHYLWLISGGKTRAALAKPMVLDEWANQLRRALRAIAAVVPLVQEQARKAEEAERARKNSFEGQLERVRAGARVVQKIGRVDAQRDYSLTGNAWGMM